MTLTITAHGDTDGDLIAAVEEALARLRAGFTSGHDMNETGSFVFDVDDES